MSGQDWATDGSNAPDSDAVGLFLRDVHICDCGAAGCEDGAADETCDESKCQQHAEIFGINDTQLEQDKCQEGTDEDRVPPKEWHLR